MLHKILNFLSLRVVSRIDWTWLKMLFTGKAYDLTAEDRENARSLMSNGVYIWVSRRETHLTTYIISLFDWLLSLGAWIRCGFKGKRPRFGFWSHSFINYDDNEVVEAVGRGVEKNYFDLIFNCDAIAALVPNRRLVSISEWANIKKQLLEEMDNQIGKKYDTDFNIDDESKLSCIELVRLVLKKRVRLYDLKFQNFEHMIKTYRNVTPQMLYDSGDFEIVWERRG